MSADAVSQLSLALAVTGQVVAGVGDAQWAGRTPCTEWCVGDVVRHLVAGNNWFAACVSGQPRPAGAESDVPDSELAGAYREAGAALVDAFSAPGALERIVTIPIGQVPGIAALHVRITEILVHGWDVATATGQPVEFPEQLAEAEIAFSQDMLADIPPGRFLAPPEPVEPDAPAIDRLAATLGRDVRAHRRYDLRGIDARREGRLDALCTAR